METSLSNYILLALLLTFSNINVQAQKDILKDYKKRYIISLDIIKSELIGKMSERRPFELGDKKDRILSFRDDLSYGISFSFDRRINKNFSITSDLGYHFLKGKLETESASSVADTLGRLEWYYNFDFTTHYFTNGYYVQYCLSKHSNTYLNIGGSILLQFAENKKGRRMSTLVSFSQTPPIRTIKSDNDNQKIKYDFLRLQLFAQMSLSQWLRFNKQNLIRLQIRYGLPLLNLAAPIDLKTRLITFSIGYKFREWEK